MQKKHLAVAGLVVIVVFAVGYAVGWFSHGSRISAKTLELETTISEFETTVARLETTVGLANGTIKSLNNLRATDRATIAVLAVENKRAIEIARTLRFAIDGISESSSAIGNSSSAIESGLDDAIRAIDEIIADNSK